MDSEVMITTIDNPYNPFTQFEDWKAFDEYKGYYTCEYLARIANLAPDLSDEESSLEMKRAIDEICRLNILGIYKKVYSSDREGEGEGEEIK